MHTDEGMYASYMYKSTTSRNAVSTKQWVHQASSTQSNAHMSKSKSGDNSYQHESREINQSLIGFTYGICSNTVRRPSGNFSIPGLNLL